LLEHPRKQESRNRPRNTANPSDGRAVLLIFLLLVAIRLSIIDIPFTIFPFPLQNPRRFGRFSCGAAMDRAVSE
jgi:hypothetical protein